MSSNAPLVLNNYVPILVPRSLLPVLDYAFEVRVDFDRRMVCGPVCGGGNMGFTSVGGGAIRGPRLNGRVVPLSGGDYAHVRSDGVVEINAHYLLEASDGTLIYLHNRGYIDDSERRANAILAPGKDDCYFRITPVFRTPIGPHDWLTRTVILGAGERHQDPDHVVFRYYVVL